MERSDETNNNEKTTTTKSDAGTGTVGLATFESTPNMAD